MFQRVKSLNMGHTRITSYAGSLATTRPGTTTLNQNFSSTKNNITRSFSNAQQLAIYDKDLNLEENSRNVNQDESQRPMINTFMDNIEIQGACKSSLNIGIRSSAWGFGI
jgi:hypothetical protein